MNTILVPTNFSKCADNAVKYAILLEEKSKSRLIFFHSTFLSIPTQSQTAIYLQTVEAEKKNKTKILEKNINNVYKSLSKKRNQDNSSLVVKFSSNFVIDIIEMLKNKDIDLLVMGTKGATGLKEMLIGSNTARVIERAKCPVIAVPDGVSFNDIRQITFATDYHESDIDALKKLIEIAKPFSAKINIIHACDEELTPETEEMGMRMFRNIVLKKVKYNHFSFRIIFGNYLEKILQNHIKEDSPDLLAMSTQKRTFFENFFETSFTQKMAYHTSIPVLAFHHKKESEVFI